MWALDGVFLVESVSILRLLFELYASESVLGRLVIGPIIGLIIVLSSVPVIRLSYELEAVSDIWLLLYYY